MTALSFKGLSLVNKIGDVQVELPRHLIGTVYIAALLALTDAATAPADVILEAQCMNRELALTVSLQPTRREIVSGVVASYRNIEREDVAALAETQSVKLTHSAYSVQLQVRLTTHQNA